MTRFLQLLLACLAALLLAGQAMSQPSPSKTMTASTSPWQLVPREGITQGNLKIAFGQQREALKAAMAAAGFVPPQPGRYPDEDDFLTPDEATFIRVRYDGTKVQDIEFLGGALTYQGVPLHGGTTFAQVKKQFKGMKLQLRDTQWLGDGQDCPELGINIATRGDVGGDGDGIEWVILSSTFK